MNGGPPTCQCTHDVCMHDSDCAAGETCACHGAPYMGGYGNACMSGNCRVDSDCGPGGYCSPTYGSQNCGGLSGYYCHTPADQCIDDSDCSDGGGATYCAYSAATNRWQCELPLECL